MCVMFHDHLILYHALYYLWISFSFYNILLLENSVSQDTHVDFVIFRQHDLWEDPLGGQWIELDVCRSSGKVRAFLVLGDIHVRGGRTSDQFQLH